jgi:predicted glutamine amidotransferase
MCRLLCVVGSDDAALRRVLNASEGFCELSHKHQDGWGMAWYDEADELALVKGALPAWSDPEYDTALEAVRGDIAVVHLRRASVGILVELRNCHPFAEGDVAFEHNGQFRVTDRLRDFYAENGLRALGGTTDSELYFGLVLHFFSRTASWPDAIVEAAGFITRDLWLDDPDDNPNALNCLLLTPEALYGYSQWEPAKLLPDSGPDAYVLRLAERPDSVVVTSTHWSVDAAVPLPERAVAEVQRGSLAVTVHPPHPLGGQPD